MKTVRQIQEEAEGLTEILTASSYEKIPQMLVLKRRSIRVFPDGTKVAMYRSDQLGVEVPISFTEKSNPFVQG